MLFATGCGLTFDVVQALYTACCFTVISFMEALKTRAKPAATVLLHLGRVCGRHVPKDEGERGRDPRSSCQEVKPLLFCISMPICEQLIFFISWYAHDNERTSFTRRAMLETTSLSVKY